MRQACQKSRGRRRGVNRTAQRDDEHRLHETRHGVGRPAAVRVRLRRQHRRQCGEVGTVVERDLQPVRRRTQRLRQWQYAIEPRGDDRAGLWRKAGAQTQHESRRCQDKLRRGIIDGADSGDRPEGRDHGREAIPP